MNFENFYDDSTTCLSNKKLVFQLPLGEFPLSWRGVKCRKALVGEAWCSLAYPWIAMHVSLLPKGLHIYFFNMAHKHTTLSCYYFAQSYGGLEKLIAH